MQELIKALIKAKKDFKDVVKDTKAFNYKYATLDQVIATIEKPLSDNGLVVIQKPIGGDNECGVLTTLWHESGEGTTSEFSTKLFKGDCQAVGSQITYFRRYSLLAMMGLSPVDDDGQATLPKTHKNAPKENNAPKQKNDPIKEKLVNEINELAKQLMDGKSQQEKVSWMKAALEVNTFGELHNKTEANLNGKIDALKAMIELGSV